MPTLNWNDLVTTVGPDAEWVFGIIQPFLPALARAGIEVYQGFLTHLGNGDYDAMVQLMYPHMTLQERAALEDQTYTQAVEAAQAAYDRVQLIKSVALKLMIAILTRVATGGLI